MSEESDVISWQPVRIAPVEEWHPLHAESTWRRNVGTVVRVRPAFHMLALADIYKRCGATRIFEVHPDDKVKLGVTGRREHLFACEHQILAD